MSFLVSCLAWDPGLGPAVAEDVLVERLMPGWLPGTSPTARTGDASGAGPPAERVWLANHPRTTAVIVLTILLIIIVLLLLFGGGWGYSRRGRRI